MARLNPKQIVTANGDYDFPLIKDRLYAFEFYTNSGSATITPKQILKTSEGTSTSSLYHPTSGLSSISTASAVQQGFEFRATGDTFRGTISSASSLNGAWSIAEVPHGRS